MDNVIKSSLGISGRVELSVTKESGKTESYSFNNLITHKGLDELLGNIDGYNLFKYILLGEGSNTPTVNDTELQLPLNTVSLDSAGDKRFNLTERYLPVTDDILKREIEVLFVCWGREFADRNFNATEIGLAYKYSSYTKSLITHALIKDSQDNPTSISISPSDRVEIKYYVLFEINCNESKKFEIQVDYSDSEQKTWEIEYIRSKPKVQYRINNMSSHYYPLSTGFGANYGYMRAFVYDNENGTKDFNIDDFTNEQFSYQNLIEPDEAITFNKGSSGIYYSIKINIPYTYFDKIKTYVFDRNKENTSTLVIRNNDAYPFDLWFITIKEKDTGHPPTLAEGRSANIEIKVDLGGLYS